MTYTGETEATTWPLPHLSLSSTVRRLTFFLIELNLYLRLLWFVVCINVSILTSICMVFMQSIGILYLPTAPLFFGFFFLGRVHFVSLRCWTLFLFLHIVVLNLRLCMCVFSHSLRGVFYAYQVFFLVFPPSHGCLLSSKMARLLLALHCSR